MRKRLFKLAQLGRKLPVFSVKLKALFLESTNYFGNLAPRLNLESVHIMCDSSVAIETVDKCKISVRQQTYNTLIYLRRLLYDMNIRVVLVKIKGHSGITGNETADTEARQVKLVRCLKEILLHQMNVC